MSKRARNRNCVGVCQGPLEHTCALCSFMTNSVTGIRLHLKATHEENEKKSTIEKEKVSHEKCTVCGETFKEMKEVIKHVKKIHRQK